jgi:antirestriction protein ArdC
MPTQNDIRSQITNQIIEALEEGVIPWRKPWTAIGGSAFPTNISTKRAYRGVNVLLLQLAEMKHRYPFGLWASYKQWQALGGQVRRGEKGTQIVFFKPVTRTRTDDNGQEVEESFPLLRTFHVFNVAQVDGEIADQYRNTIPVEAVFDDVDQEGFFRAIEATKADIRYGGDEAVYFRPPHDHIQLPHAEQFSSFPSFAETLLHELVHWSEWRLAWDGNYAEGELRAEIGSVFLSQALDIPHSSDLTNHVAYIQSWLKALRNDPSFIIRASSAASKAADFILSYSRQSEEEPVEQPAAA